MPCSSEIAEDQGFFGFYNRISGARSSNFQKKLGIEGLLSYCLFSGNKPANVESNSNTLNLAAVSCADAVKQRVFNKGGTMPHAENTVYVEDAHNRSGGSQASQDGRTYQSHRIGFVWQKVRIA